MGLFTTPQPQPEPQPKTHYTATAITLAAIIALATIPAVVIILPILILIGEKRRVRQSRWALTATITTILLFLLTGAQPQVMANWLLAGIPALWGSHIDPTTTNTILATLRTQWEVVGTPTLTTHHLVASLPVAVCCMCMWWWMRSYQLQLRGENEGAEYSNIRPVGYLDKARAQNNRKEVETGQWSTKHPMSVAVGIGTYGDVAEAPMDDFKKTIAIVGTSRSGKTRLANSIAAQQVNELGCGHIIIDFKGDDDLAVAKAELAHQRGVPFLHFKLTSRTSGQYRQPHPYAPDRPATYDPFRRGNGSSKASMLLNSVPRDGDAAVYMRKAFEVVTLAYDLAALTGYDQQTIGDHKRPIGGLTVLAHMLDQDNLQNQATHLTADTILTRYPFLTRSAAEDKARALKTRLAAITTELAKPKSTLSGAVEDVRSTVASYINDSAAGPLLTPGPIPALRIDLVRAILREEIVLFSLPAQEYDTMAPLIGTLVVLDLQNAVATLRDQYGYLAENYETTGSGGADATPWKPLVVQIEELGSIHSTAAADALLGLFNKSADVGIRPILSTQSLADLEAVDGTGVWLRQLTGQLDHLFSLQLSESHDAEKVAAFSGIVQKKIATEQKAVKNSRTRLFQGAGEAGHIIARTEDKTRIGEGEALQLDRDRQELLWVSKMPSLRATHTTWPEGPNNWAEHIQLATVHEPPHHFDPFDDRTAAKNAHDKRQQVFTHLVHDLKTNTVLHTVLEGKREAVDVATTTTYAPQPAAIEPTNPGETPPEEPETTPETTPETAAPLPPDPNLDVYIENDPFAD